MKETILIVEDNPLNLELATDLLEAAGFAVAQANTGEDGVRLAGKLKPALVLMDLSLPGMDGLSAVQWLKADPATKHLSIIALTAHAMRGDDEAAIRAGCDGYISKPIDTRSFPSQIRDFIMARSLCKPKP